MTSTGIISGRKGMLTGWGNSDIKGTVTLNGTVNGWGRYLGGGGGGLQ